MLERERTWADVSEKRAEVRSVFPTPVGPYSSTPLGNWTPLVGHEWGRDETHCGVAPGNLTSD